MAIWQCLAKAHEIDGQMATKFCPYNVEVLARHISFFLSHPLCYFLAMVPERKIDFNKVQSGTK